MRVYQANHDKIVRWNTEKAATEGYWLGLNAFADLTHDEFRKRMNLVARGPPKRQRRAQQHAARDESGTAVNPSFVDWRLNGSVTAVKTQGACGACWAFASTGAMEGAHQRKTGKLVSLSEQQLIDCEPTNLGCRGGLEPNAFSYVIHSSHGIKKV